MSDPWLRLLPSADLPESLRTRLPEAQRALLAWHKEAGRHTLPWNTEDPYGIWLSEIMLQQTQVATGLVRYPAWMAAFPTVASLAAAPSEAVMAQWEGLGYYARARNLHKAAQQMVRDHGGQMPQARPDRLALPGIGPSTASAIGAFAFGQREAIFDGNVERVWSRWCGDEGPPDGATPTARRRWLWSWAQEATPQTAVDIKSWTQVIMDLGATVCTPRNPKCPQCPLRSTCRAAALGTPERWPTPRAKKAIPRIAIAWQWTRQGNKVAAVLRPDTGIWGGLWTPPERPGEEGLGDGPPPEGQGQGLRAWGEHRLTHRLIRWSLEPTITPLSADPPLDLQWLTRAEWEAKAWPRPLRRWWTDLTPQARDAWWADPAG